MLRLQKVHFMKVLRPTMYNKVKPWLTKIKDEWILQSIIAIIATMDQDLVAR